jgi:hypothetical protein
VESVRKGCANTTRKHKRTIAYCELRADIFTADFELSRHGSFVKDDTLVICDLVVIDNVDSSRFRIASVSQTVLVVSPLLVSQSIVEVSCRIEDVQQGIYQRLHDVGRISWMILESSAPVNYQNPGTVLCHPFLCNKPVVIKQAS